MLALLSRLDDWLATRMFVPLIIKLCQKSGMSQYAVANYATTFAFGCSFWNLSHGHSWSDLIFQVLIGLILMINVALTALYPNRPLGPSKRLRAIEWPFLLLTLFYWYGGRSNAFDVGFWLLMLVANYARGIDRIPPEEKKQREVKGAVEFG